jgi:NAD(P)-dependent dehydrogenase (short-subunit alcohol dehydrogenase family)
MAWTANDIPPQTGKTALITGANSGIGYAAALELARNGAHVVLACRDSAKGLAALASIRAACPTASASLEILDLADLASIRACAASVRSTRPTIDLLINNAGIMAIPRCTTADGFEMQFGTNHLGHFALTGLLLDRVLAAPAGRIVTVSSNAHKFGGLHFDDLQSERRYHKWLVYSRSKLANLLFAYGLDRRLRAAGARAISVACHPGYAATNLQGVGPRMQGSPVGEAIMRFANRAFAQPAAMGALPTLYAATAPDVHGGDYFGPGGFAEQAGYPKQVQSNRRSRDTDAQDRLWAVSEQLTGVSYEALH